MKSYLTILLMLLMSVTARGQLAIKTNLFYDATTTPNLGAEVRVGSRSTLNLVYGINAWTFDSKSHGERKLKHWLLMPEYRWWTCTPFNGHFIGAHLMGGEMNAAKVAIPFPGAFFGKDNAARIAKNGRIQGGYAGVGFTYGYQWILGRHWNAEAEIGVGYGHLWYDKYTCGKCSNKAGRGNSNYIGLTKLGLSILYLF